MSTCGGAGIPTAVCGRSRCGSGRRSRRADDLAFRELQGVIHPFLRRGFSSRVNLVVFTEFGRAAVLSLDCADDRGTAVDECRPSFKYSFVTGDASDPAAPSAVEWRDGKGTNTGRHVLAAVGYLYDAAPGLIGFRSTAND